MRLNISDIKQLKKGAKVQGIYLFNGFEVRSGGRNGRYGIGSMADRTGALPVKIWELTAAIESILHTKRVVYLEGIVDVYNDIQQIIIQKINTVDGDSLAAARQFLLRTTNYDVNQLMNELRAMVASMRNLELQRLLNKLLLEDDYVCDCFCRWPAANSIHHDYIGGLLQHTWEIARAAQAIAAVNDDINFDLLLAMVLLHDVGKIHEITIDELGLPNGYSKSGKLLGHIYIGMEMVDRCCCQYQIDEEINLLLKHAIYSHHGSKEFGSPVPPKIKEAQILHFLDNISAKREIFSVESENIGQGEFSNRVFALQNSEVYLPQI